MGFVDVKTAAIRLGVTRQTIHQLIKRGDLKVAYVETRGYVGRPSRMLNEDDILELAYKRSEKAAKKTKAATKTKAMSNREDILSRIENLDVALDLVREMLLEVAKSAGEKTDILARIEDIDCSLDTVQHMVCSLNKMIIPNS